MQQSCYLHLSGKIILTFWFLLCGICRRCVVCSEHSSSNFCGDKDSCLSRTHLQVSLSNTSYSKCRTFLSGSWAVLQPVTGTMAQLYGRGTGIIMRSPHCWDAPFKQGSCNATCLWWWGWCKSCVGCDSSELLCSWGPLLLNTSQL